MALAHLTSYSTISFLWQKRERERDFIATHFNCNTWVYGLINLGVYESNPTHKCISRQFIYLLWIIYGRR